MFEEEKAVGMKYEKHGTMKQVRAHKEVILSGGGINSPQLLLLSGVGNAYDLNALDNPVVQHLPGVGKNLQDHLELYIQQKCKKPITLYKYQWKFPINMVKTGIEWFVQNTGPAATAHLESGAFIRSQPGVPHPDIQFHFLPSVVINHGQDLGSCHAYQVHVGPLRSTTKGRLWITSKDPHEYPLMDLNYLSTEQDRKEFRDFIKLTREVFAQKAFDEFRDEEIQPGKDIQTDSQMDALVREKADSAYHPSCTCKMGSPTDPMTVVDSECKVLGVENLRVMDASIMPSVVSGNLNGPTTMVAEKAADIILGNPPLPKSTAPVWKPKSLDTQR